jgi:hypothetical protein
MGKKIKLRNAEKIFKAELTKMRSEDFLKRAIQNQHLLSFKESKALENLYGRTKSNKYEGGNEFFVRRTKGKIELLPFDDD